MFTYGDAVYCAKFAHELHKMDTPYFSTLQYYDRLLRDVAQLLTRYTHTPPSPSQHYGTQLLARYTHTPPNPSQHYGTQLLTRYTHAPPSPSQHYGTQLLTRYTHAPPSQHCVATGVKQAQSSPCAPLTFFGTGAAAAPSTRPGGWAGSSRRR
jgi:hypothetical protein